MAFDDRIDANKAATDAEAGRGCSVVDAFDGKSLQSQLIALAEMKQKFQKDHSNLDAFVMDWSPLNLYVKPGLVHSSIFSESFDGVQRKIEYNCTEKSPTGDIKKTIHRSF